MTSHPIQVSFSGGRSSGMMSKLMWDNYPRDQILFTFANTGKEKPETLDFVQACSDNFGFEVHWVEFRNNDQGYQIVNHKTASRNGEPFDMLIEKKNYLPNPVARFCTADLKVRPMKKFILSLGVQHWDCALGLRYDEKKRITKLEASQDKERWDYIFPLEDFQIRVQDVAKFWNSQSFDLGISQHEGNCDLCFLKSRNIKRQLIRDNPGIEDWWIEKEQQIGATFRSDINFRTIQHQGQSSGGLDAGYSCHCGM